MSLRFTAQRHEHLTPSGTREGEPLEYILRIAQVVIALGLLNVWLLRFNTATAYRGGTATNMKEEFATYGLPLWFMWVVGALKITIASLLLVGLWLPQLIHPAAIGLAILMLGAIAMHIKVGDAFKRTAPAAAMLVLSLLVAVS